MNALTILVAKYLSKNNLSRNQLAQLLGYKNISKGLRNLGQYCHTLIDKNQIRSKLQKVLNIPETEYQKAVNQVQSDLENVKRSKFKPSIQIIPSSRPSAPVFALAMVPSLMNIKVPDINNCNYDQELQIVFNAYKNHQLNRCSKIYGGSNYNELIQIVEKMDQDGETYPWTITKGYKYFRTYDQTLVFNRDGELVENINSHIEPNKVTVSINGKTILPSIIGE